MPAMFSRTLGAVWLGPPRTWRGTIISLVAGTAVLARSSFFDIAKRSSVLHYLVQGTLKVHIRGLESALRHG
jgi:hypothetical protein